MHTETIKTILRVNNPSEMLVYLKNTYKLDSELETLIGVPQDEKNHPEGNVFMHTCMVLDEAANISAREHLNTFDNAVLRLAAICHDMGKATHTQVHDDGRITAYGHPEAGLVPATTFMQRSHISLHIMQEVLPLVNLHMAWVGFYTPDITSKSVRKLIRKVHPSNLGMLSLIVEADMSGRGGIYYQQGLPQRMKDILTVAATLNNDVDQYPDPLVTGDDIMLIAGIAPSPLLGKVKTALYKAQLEGRFTTKEAGIYFLLHNIKIEGKV